MQQHPSGSGEHHGAYGYAWPPGFPYMPPGAHPYGQPPMPYGAYQNAQQHVGHVVSPPYGPTHAQPGPAAAPRPKRRRITPEQLEILTGVFAEHDTPGYELREKLAGQLNMTIREVQVWFQNRRAKVNRERLQAQQQAQIEIQRQQLEAAKAALEGIGATAAAERLSPLPPLDGPVQPPLRQMAMAKSEPDMPSPGPSESSLKPPTPPSRLTVARPIARRASSSSLTANAPSPGGPNSAPLPQAGPSLAAYPHYGYASQHPVQHSVDPYGRTSPHPQYVYGHPQMYMPTMMVQSPGVGPQSPAEAAAAAVARSYMDQRAPAPQTWGPQAYRGYGAYDEGPPPVSGTSPAQPSFAQAHPQAQVAPPQAQAQSQVSASAQAQAAAQAQPTHSPHGHPLTLPPLWSLGFNGAHHAQQQSSVGRGPSGSHPEQTSRKHSSASSSGGSRESNESPPPTGTNATEFTPSTAGDEVHVKDEADD